MTNPIYSFATKRIDGTPAALSEYAGNVLLIVNVASKCGLTPQYDGLEKLYATYRDKGFVVLGFPANNFDGQEPGTEAEIQDFCRSVYGVDFPMFAKLSVRGPDQSPLYRYLSREIPARTISPAVRALGKKPNPDVEVRWNFEKFLISRDGKVIGRFDPDTKPQDEVLVGAVEQALA